MTKQRKAKHVNNVSLMHHLPQQLLIDCKVGKTLVSFTTRSFAVCPRCQSKYHDTNTLAITKGIEELNWCECGCVWLYHAARPGQPKRDEILKCPGEEESNE